MFGYDLNISLSNMNGEHTDTCSLIPCVQYQSLGVRTEGHALDESVQTDGKGFLASVTVPHLQHATLAGRGDPLAVR